mgnify:CR=1 FL=1|jgi:hypothetical protein|tara:strand:- start:1188 stop:1289 length:102 start_codon:yes stop_codon:yes gene_type:complete
MIDQLITLLVYFVIPWGALLCLGGWLVDRYEQP